MTTEEITLNEFQNDGTCIHVYLLDEINAWIAFGLSAFHLRLLVKSNSWRNSFRNFSKTMQMPYTIIDHEIALKLAELPTLEQKTDAGYLFIRVEDKVNMDEYSRWTGKLRETPSDAKEIVVETRVSAFVPKSGYIKDNMSNLSRNSKRIMDLCASGIALAVFSPLFLACYIAVKLEDGGPAIYKQERIGRFGRPFYIYKFRSMRLDAEKKGPQLSASCGNGDSRLTKVGRFLRAHHLDELPQLWNVFCGDMAFVGPRPERRFFINQILEYDSRYVYLYQIRPGVTSYATLYNGYTDTMQKMLCRLEYDLYYLGHRSFWVDFKILFNTFCAIVFGKKF